MVRLVFGIGFGPVASAMPLIRSAGNTGEIIAGFLLVNTGHTIWKAGTKTEAGSG